MTLQVLHLSQSDCEGGAGRAAFRLHVALQASGIESIFHPGRNLLDDPEVRPARRQLVGLRFSQLTAFLNAIVLRSYRSRLQGELFSPSLLSYGRPDLRLVLKADIVCLHWLAGAFLRPAKLRQINKPIVWRLSDLWPFTGGCHYPGACRGFEATCGRCPMLGSTRSEDLSRLGLRQRARAYSGLDLTFVAPSRWIAEEARRSSVIGERRIIHIPTGVELDIFKPRNRAAARARFGLPGDACVLLFGALGALSDTRKGFPECMLALQSWVANRKQREAVLAVFGGGGKPPPSVAGLTVYDIGRLDNRALLADLYNAADLLLAPFAEDNLPNVVLEAIACGTPVVAYRAGGIPDAVVEGSSGALAPPGDARAFGEALSRALESQDSLSRGARARAEALFDLRACATSYRRLFEEVAHRNQSLQV